MKAILAKGLMLPMILVIYLGMISEGFRVLIATTALKLYKMPVPGLIYLGRWAPWNKLDLAHILALFLCFASSYLWIVVLRAFLGDEQVFRRSGWNPEAYKKFVLTLAVIVLGGDLILFYIATVTFGWGGVAFSLTAMIATVLYAAIIVFTSFVVVNSSDRPRF
jgi:hypothetical protein